MPVVSEQLRIALRRTQQRPAGVGRIYEEAVHDPFSPNNSSSFEAPSLRRFSFELQAEPDVFRQLERDFVDFSSRSSTLEENTTLDPSLPKNMYISREDELLEQRLLRYLYHPEPAFGDGSRPANNLQSDNQSSAAADEVACSGPLHPSSNICGQQVFLKSGVDPASVMGDGLDVVLGPKKGREGQKVNLAKSCALDSSATKYRHHSNTLQDNAYLSGDWDKLDEMISTRAGLIIPQSAQSPIPPSERRPMEDESTNRADKRQRDSISSWDRSDLCSKSVDPIPGTSKNTVLWKLERSSCKKRYNDTRSWAQALSSSHQLGPSLQSAQLDGPFDNFPAWHTPLHFEQNDASNPNLIALPSRRFGSSESYQPQTNNLHIIPYYLEADGQGNRYDDGEVRRYGAGESYRPFNRDRSPRSNRSPPRDRARSPPGGSDCYVPHKSPRRRSRSNDRHRPRDRSRARDDDSWRRRDRSRSRARSTSRRSPRRRSTPPRRTPPRRSSPRYGSPRRDDRGNRDRSPRREYDSRISRRRSRSPYDRDRRHRTRSPIRSPGPRGASYRPRSRSPDRRESRYVGSASRRSPPPRESLNTSAMTSRSVSRSRRSSLRPSPSRGRDDRSRPESPARSPEQASQTSTTLPVRETPKAPAPLPEGTSPSLKSPPRGPAALRQPPTGPSGSRTFTGPTTSPAVQSARQPPTPTAPSSRPDMTSPAVPPAGPRGYVAPPRGGAFAGRGGRGGWPTIQGRPQGGPPPSPGAAPPTGPSSGPGSAPGGSIPTGPRASSTTSSAAPSPSLASKPFNPPTGPASQQQQQQQPPLQPPLQPQQRPTLAQNLLATMPPIVPGGKADPGLAVLTTGVTRELELPLRRLRDEEEKLREETRARQERLRRSLRVWDRLERESKAFELKSDLSEKSLKNLAGEGLGGAAF